MNMRKSWSRKSTGHETRDRDIFALRRQGMTQVAIGEKYGLTRARVQQLIARSGHEAEIEAACASVRPEPYKARMAQRKAEHKAARQAQIESVLSLYRAGKNQTEIGVIMGKAQTRIGAIIIANMSDYERYNINLRNWRAGVDKRVRTRAHGKKCKKCKRPTTSSTGVCSRTPGCKREQQAIMAQRYRVKWGYSDAT